MECEFSQKSWEATYRMENIGTHWNGGSMELTHKDWISDRDTARFRALPCILTWGIWIARNRYIFKNKWTEPDVVVVNSMGILQAFPQVSQNLTMCFVEALELDKSIPWAFFDGAAQGTPMRCGGVV